MDHWWTETYWSTFFYAHICHVCKKLNASKECNRCEMIVYCNEEHQKQYWTAHQDLCKAIHRVCDTYKAELSACRETPKLTKLLKEKVIQILQRNLELHEVQMLKYPKICLVCTKITQLRQCEHCTIVWFCPEHENRHDRNICNLLKLCIEIDLSFFHRMIPPDLTAAYMRVTSYDKEFSDMREFISTYGDIKTIRSEVSPEILEIGQSIHLTRPLTVHYGMRMLDYLSTYEKQKTQLVIHVLAAYKSELVTLREWEVLLHIFPLLKSLKLVLIGPLMTFTKMQKVCDICERNGKTYSVEWKDIDPLHEGDLSEPDLVTIFCNDSYDSYNATFEVKWKASLQYVSSRKYSLLVCYSRENMLIHKIINTELSSTTECRKYKNPFASLKPNREYEDESDYSVYYENTYLNVYTTLRS